MHLTKTIPEKKKTIRFRWCREELMEMSPSFRQARAAMLAPLNFCFWCNRKFEDGDPIALAQPEQGGNKVLCSDCASALLATVNRRNVKEAKAAAKAAAESE
jgi:hypothetical protein